jgi:hypothetical protein
MAAGSVRHVPYLFFIFTGDHVIGGQLSLDFWHVEQSVPAPAEKDAGQ